MDDLTMKQCLAMMREGVDSAHIIGVLEAKLNDIHLGASLAITSWAGTHFMRFGA